VSGDEVGGQLELITQRDSNGRMT